jgi:tRNA nucleotidyltransferase/poly(A) polymerase
MTSILPILKAHPDWFAVEKIYHHLEAHGYKAFLAGGCVRDALLGRQAHDLDIVTDASPDWVERLFPHTVSVGKAFGIMRVIIEKADIEVATFRADGVYVDGRHPESVQFSSPQEDAQRRDFTINALFFDLQTEQVLDFVKGEDDLLRGLIRAVGEPEKRFEEDHLRILRAARFVSQLGFSLESKTLQAMKLMAHKVQRVSGERIRDELVKLLKGTCVQQGLMVMEETGILRELFPFRLRNNKWSGSMGATDAWQLLALFFREASEGELDEGLQSLRLSTQESKAIERSWLIWNEAVSILTRGEGSIMRSFESQGVVWALKALLWEGHEAKDKIKKLLDIWDLLGGKLPSPLLTGHDLKSKLTGSEIGRCLNLAHELQIEGRIKNREDVLKWLELYLERLKNE